MPTERRSPRSFRRQLASTVLLSIAITLIASSIATAWIMSTWLRGSILSNLDEIVAEFAKHSVVVYLLEDEKVAKSTAAMVRSIRIVTSVMFLKRDLSPLFQDETLPSSVIEHKGSKKTTELCWEDPRYVHCIGPVATEPGTSPFDPAAPAYEPRAEVIGHVYVSIDKSLLGTLTKALIAANILIALVFGILLLTWLRSRVRLMTEPLSDLAETMARAGQGESGVRAELRGPAETQAIAGIFNLMIEKIEHNQELLESEVAIRTLELREARDAALTVSHLKSDFLSMLSHEIRTPLTSMEGHTEIAIRDLRFMDDADDIIKRLDVVLGTGREMLVIIDHILNYTRAEAGKAEITLSQVDIVKLLGKVKLTVQPLVLKNHDELLVEVHGEREVVLDEGKVLVIIHNLVTNACKHTTNGQIRLRIDCKADTLSIIVADTGAGIPDRYHALIFEPFSRVAGSTADDGSGVGLGLAITKRFCELLGGGIRVESRVGIGSTFTVTIPLPIRQNGSKPS